MGVNYAGYATPRLDLGEGFKEYESDPGDFIAEEVLAVFDSQKKAAKFPRRKRASLLQVAETRRAARGGFNRIDSRMGEQSFDCETHGLEGVVDDEERALYASDFDAEMATVEDVAMALAIAKERRVATATFNTTTWTGASLYTDVSASPWDSPNADIIGNCIYAAEKVRRSSGARANALIIGVAQLANIFANTGIKAQFPGAPMITLAMLEAALPKLFGIERLIVGRAIYDTAGEDPTGNTAPSLTDVWSDDYAMIARIAPKGARITFGCIGRTIRWSQLDPAKRAMTYREEKTMGDVVRLLECVDELVIDETFGHLLKIDA